MRERERERQRERETETETETERVPVSYFKHKRDLSYRKKYRRQTCMSWCAS